MKIFDSRASLLTFWITCLTIFFMVMDGPSVRAQGPVQKPSPPFAFTGQWGPAAVPTSTTNLCIAQQGDSCTTTKSFYITQITLSNRSATADTCYIVDRQSSPVSLFGTAAVPMSFAGSTTYEMVAAAGRLMIGGMTWACTNGTIDAHIVYGY